MFAVGAPSSPTPAILVITVGYKLERDVHGCSWSPTTIPLLLLDYVQVSPRLSQHVLVANVNCGAQGAETYRCHLASWLA